MDNKEMEKTKLETEELDPVAGGKQYVGPIEKEYTDYLNKMTARYGPKHQGISEYEDARLTELRHAAWEEAEEKYYSKLSKGEKIEWYNAD